MRIALVCPYNYFRPGGVQACINDLSIELAERGHYVRIIIPRPKNVPTTIDQKPISHNNACSRLWKDSISLK